MKKYIISILALTLVHVVTFAKGEKMIVKVEKTQAADAIVVQLANLEKVATEVSIQDLDGKVWFSMFLRKQDGYHGKLILNGMPMGNFLLYVKNKSRLIVKAFALMNDEIMFFENAGLQEEDAPKAINVANSHAQKAKLIARFANLKNVSIQMQLANLDRQATTIRLVAVGGGAIFEQKVKNEYGYAKSLNLKGIESGDYFLVVEVGDTTIVQLVQLEKNEHLVLGDLQKLENRLLVSNLGEPLTDK